MQRIDQVLLWTFLIYICAPVAFGDVEVFQATVADKNSPSVKAPDGMVWVPGGEFSMGANLNGGGSCEMPMASNDAGPVHRVRVDGFWMDATAVTNEQFEKFVQ